MADSRVQVLLFDENVALAQALASKLASEAVAITVTHDLGHLRARLSDNTAAGLIVCVNSAEEEQSLLSELRVSTHPLAVFRAETLTPLWELQDWLSELAVARSSKEPASCLELLFGQAPVMQELREHVRRVAHFHELSVLITGETGTGKELVAQAIHRLTSPGEPFVSVNCAAIPASLFESELFGHTRGAFTDAEDQRLGLLEQAGAGTLFLDEVGELPPELQPKLLRSLETRRFRRLGSQREQPLRARVVSATHVDLLDPARRFRQDLYFRLTGYAVHCPPLRERTGDVRLLAERFLDHFCREHLLPPAQFTPQSLELLSEHSFPGNVRELRGIVESLAMGCVGRSIELSDVESVLHPTGLPLTIRPAMATPRPEYRPTPAPFTTAIARQLVGQGRPFASLHDLEKHVILAAHAECKGCLSRMSKALGVARSTLRDKLRRYELESASEGATPR